MSASVETAALDRIVEALGADLSDQTARAILDLRVDAAMQARLEQLADKSTAGELTDDERAEYETYVRAVDFITILQLKARRILSGADD